MKRLLLILALVAMPFTASGGSVLKDDRANWFCYQMGKIGHTKLLVTTPVHKNDKDVPHDIKAEQFQDQTTRVLGPQFAGQYDSHCIDYEKEKKAQKHLDKIIKRAKKLGFRILQLKLTLRKGKQ